MKKQRLFLLSGLIFFVQPVPGQNKQVAAKIDSLIQKLGEKFMKTPGAVGLSIGVYSNNEDYFRNFGTTEKGKISMPSENTLYEIGSITKTFASYLLGKAVLEKKVNLSDDIRKYIDGDYPNLQFEGQPIQLVHLANTTAGIPEWLPSEPEELAKASPDSVSFLRAKIYGDYTRKDFFEALRHVKLDTLPGLKRKHSNGGAQLLAYILENVYQLPFEKLVQQYILRPNGMKQSFFAVPDSKRKQLANGYNSNGVLVPAGLRGPYFRSIGGLQCSISDLLKYIRLQLDRENEVVAISHKRTIDVDAKTDKVAGLLPDSLINAGIYSVGLNWFLYQPEKGNTQIWADGGTSGFCSYLVFYPENNSGVVVLANNADEKTFRALPGIAYELSKLLGHK